MLHEPEGRARTTDWTAGNVKSIIDEQEVPHGFDRQIARPDLSRAESAYSAGMKSRVPRGRLRTSPARFEKDDIRRGAGPGDDDDDDDELPIGDPPDDDEGDDWDDEDEDDDEEPLQASAAAAQHRHGPDIAAQCRPQRDA
jgi:hypothetical protein